MKKRLFCLFFVLVTLASLTLCVSAGEIPAQRQKPRLVDDADLLTAEEEASLLRKLDEASEAYHMDLAILLTPDLGGQEIQAFADDYYDYNGYGMGDSDDGVLLVISENPRKYWVTSHGQGKFLTTPWAQNYLESLMVDKLRDNDYAGACRWFADDAATLAKGVYKGRPYNEDFKPRSASGWSIIIGGYTLLGLLIAGFAALYLDGKMMAAEGQKTAASYVVPGSLRLTERKDEYIMTNYKTKDYGRDSDEKTRSSGGSRRNAGSHKSSSGRSHGGFGGDY